MPARVIVDDYSQDEIGAKARATADLILQAAFESELLKPVWA